MSAGSGPALSRCERSDMKMFSPIIFKFLGKKVGHRLPPGRYSAVILRSRFNKAGNLEFTLTDVQPLKGSIETELKEVL